MIYRAIIIVAALVFLGQLVITTHIARGKICPKRRDGHKEHGVTMFSSSVRECTAGTSPGKVPFFSKLEHTLE